MEEGRHRKKNNEERRELNREYISEKQIFSRTLPSFPYFSRPVKVAKRNPILCQSGMW